MKAKQNQIKTSSIEVRYSDGQKIVITPHRSQDSDDKKYAFTYFDKKGRKEAYEGSWTERGVIDWLTEIIEDDNADYEAAFQHIADQYPMLRK